MATVLDITSKLQKEEEGVEDPGSRSSISTTPRTLS